jgi:hypothetical protein
MLCNAVLVFDFWSFSGKSGKVFLKFIVFIMKKMKFIFSYEFWKRVARPRVLQ